jgi:hypothetical protein
VYRTGIIACLVSRSAEARNLRISTFKLLTTGCDVDCGHLSSPLDFRLFQR